MPLLRLPMQKAFDTRIPPPVSSFRAKARNLFRSRQAKYVRIAASGKHRTPGQSGSQCFIQTVPCRKKNTVSAKDPSATLGMTIRGNAHPTRPPPSARANLRPFETPPSIGRRENAALQTAQKEDLRHENAASPHDFQPFAGANLRPFGHFNKKIPPSFLDGI